MKSTDLQDSARSALIPKTFLEIIVFCAGAAVMILEMTGSRILAPFFGTSVFVWTSLIGIILGSISLGAWWGGRIADRRPQPKILSRILILTAMWTVLLATASEPLLVILGSVIADVRLASVFGSAVLFGVPSALLGMVTPYAVRCEIKDIRSSGTTVGWLYAVSTVGSIVGTFLAGFVLIAYLPNPVILFTLAFLLALIAFIAYGGAIRRCILLMVVSILGMTFSGMAGEILNGPDFVDVNTPYNRVWIFDNYEQETGRPIKTMQTGNSNSSAMYLDSDDLVFRYMRFYRMVKHFRPDARHALLIGGGAYSYPQDFLRTFESASLDVVEIDPKLSELAKRHFRLVDHPRLQIYHQDGRTFLNAPPRRYDVYFGDVFHALYSIPFHLATLEAVQAISRALEDNGIVLMNIISAIEGEQGMFLRAEYWTFRQVFAQVYVFPVRAPADGRQVQNIILLALKSSEVPTFMSSDLEQMGYLKHRWVPEISKDVPILTDAYAPVDRYVSKIQSVYHHVNFHPVLKKILLREND